MPAAARKAPPLVNDRRGLEALLHDLSRSPVVAVDAEMDSFYSYRTKLCLMQLSTQTADYLVDPLSSLDLSPLASVMANPDQIKVFHAGENDIPYFRDQVGLEFVNLFDTHHAARVLGYTRCGLAPLLEEHFRVSLDKRFQTADWRLRPLPDDQAEYARMDTRYLLKLREIMLEQLEDEGRLAEAQCEFRRVEKVRFAERAPDPDAWFRVKGAREVPPGQRAILRELYLWREERARASDMAVFRVLPDPVLVALALRAPETAEGVRSFARHRNLQVYAEQVVAAVSRGRSAAAPVPTRKKTVNPFSGPQLATYNRLRQWRNELAEERGVEPDRVANNRLLKAIIEAEPRDLDGLSRIEGFEDWRLASYGQAVLEVLSKDGRRES